MSDPVSHERLDELTQMTTEPHLHRFESKDIDDIATALRDYKRLREVTPQLVNWLRNLRYSLSSSQHRSALEKRIKLLGYEP